MKDAIRSRVIVLAGSKGGLGKSTIAAALAVRAARDGRVAMLDWEPQGSLSVWWKLRGQPDNPVLQPFSDDVARAVGDAKAAGAKFIMIDTPPTPMQPIEAAIEASDVVVIPTRVGFFDLGGIRPTIGFCQLHRKPMLFVLNAVNPDVEGWPQMIKEATAVLRKFGPVAPKAIRERVASIRALNTGRTGPERAEPAEAKAAGAEIDALWQFIKRQGGRNPSSAAGKPRATR
jgi:cellulose biosynthesis protein BcsQ